MNKTQPRDSQPTLPIPLVSRPSRRGFLLRTPRFTVLAVVLLCSSVAMTSCRTSLMKLAYEGIGRDRSQKPAEVIKALAIEPGSSVADLGSGTGYFTFRLAESAGPDGKVYATDIDQQLLDYIAKRAKKEGYENIEAVTADYDDPNLPDGSIDLLFTCNTFHHIEDRPTYFSNLKRDLTPSSRVAIVDYKEGKHGTQRQVILDDMKAAGYQLDVEHEFLKKQNFIVFRPVFDAGPDS